MRTYEVLAELHAAKGDNRHIAVLMLTVVKNHVQDSMGNRIKFYVESMRTLEALHESFILNK